MPIMIDLFKYVPEPGNLLSESYYDELKKVFPLAELASTPQDKIYHAEGDVWTHTKMVINELINDIPYLTATTNERFVLFYACLLHDISKPQCTTQSYEDGRISSKGHSRIGAIDSRALLWKLNVPFSLREQICTIINVHQLPFYVIENADPRFSIIKLSHTVGRIDLLSAVATADMKGRTTILKKQSLENIELFNLVAQELGVWNEQFPFNDRFSRQKYFWDDGKNDPNFEVFDEKKFTVIILSGMPASGKSTYAASLNKPVISIDDCVKELKLKHGGNIGEAVHLATDQAKKLLAAKIPFVWDSTNLSRQVRQKILDLITRYGATTEVHYLETSYSEIIRRNNTRDTTLSTRKLFDMIRNWEVPERWEAGAVGYIDSSSGQSLFPYIRVNDYE